MGPVHDRVGRAEPDFPLGADPVFPYTVRVTYVYRREDGRWKIVHRHGDFLPPDESPPAG
jgi:hypothetical protein